MSDTAPTLQLNEVDLTIDGKAILRGITLNSNARRTAVLGRNGSGKTTLARVIAGLQKPSGGTVRVGSVDVVRDRAAALGAVGILFQNPDHQIIFPTVAEEIGFGLGQMGLEKRAVDAGVARVLEQFGKSHWHDAAIHTLSQGQKQLVCLMAILAMGPRLILLDEPFSGLDIPTAMHLRRVLDRVDAHLLQITHDPAAVAGYDHALWLDAGRIRRAGPAADVAQAYRGEMERMGAQDDLTDLAG